MLKVKQRPPKQYIKCKPTRVRTSFDHRIMLPKSNTHVVIEHIKKGKPGKGDKDVKR